MKLIDKLLRLPLAPEVLALLEKIDSIDSIYDASYRPIERLLDNEGFSRYERRILKKALSKISSRHAYSCAMHVVIKNELPEDPRYDKFNEQIKQQTYSAQQASTLTNSGLAGFTGQLQESGLRNYYRNAQQ